MDLNIQIQRSFLIICLLLLPSSVGFTYPNWMPLPTTCQPGPPNNTPVSDWMPPIPQQYSTIAEVSVVMGDASNGSWTYELMEEVDVANGRAYVERSFKDNSVSGVFYSDPVERLEVSDDRPCTSHPDGEQFHSFLFLAMGPVKASTDGFFQLASVTNATYVGQAVVRGRKVDHWVFCQAWVAESARINYHYYFTPKDYKGTWNEGKNPVRVTIEGNTGTLNIPGVENSENFTQTLDFMSFSGGSDPEAKADLQSPPGVCTGRPVTKPMPELPDQFQMDVEFDNPISQSSTPMQVNLRYDWDSQMMETVRGFPTVMGGLLHRPQATADDMSDSIILRRVSWVEDYNTGLLYMTVLNDMSCAVSPLPTADQSMSHGMALLRIGRDGNTKTTGDEPKFSYQGKSSFVSKPAEVWGMDDGVIIQKVYFLSRPEGDNETNTDFPVLVGISLHNRTSMGNRDLPGLLRELLEAGVNSSSDHPWNLATLKDYVDWHRKHDLMNTNAGQMSLNVYNFLPLHTDASVFHVAQCYTPQQKASVILTVKTPFVTNVQSNPTAFINAMRAGVAKAMGVSMIQVADLHPMAVVNEDKDIDVTIVTLTLLGSPPVKEMKNKQVDIETARTKLSTALENGIVFKVVYPGTTKSFTVDKDLYAFDIDLQEFSIVEEAANGGKKKKTSSHDSDGGYSGSVLAGAIVGTMLTTGFVVAIIILVVRRCRAHGDFPSIPYRRHSRDTTSDVI